MHFLRFFSDALPSSFSFQIPVKREKTPFYILSNSLSFSSQFQFYLPLPSPTKMPPFVCFSASMFSATIWSTWVPGRLAALQRKRKCKKFKKWEKEAWDIAVNMGHSRQYISFWYIRGGDTQRSTHGVQWEGLMEKVRFGMCGWFVDFIGAGTR